MPALLLVPPLAYSQACKNALSFLKMPVFGFVAQLVAPKLVPSPFRFRMMPWNLLVVWRLPHQTTRPPLLAPLDRTEPHVTSYGCQYAHENNNEHQLD